MTFTSPNRLVPVPLPPMRRPRVKRGKASETGGTFKSAKAKLSGEVRIGGITNRFCESD